MRRREFLRAAGAASLGASLGPTMCATQAAESSSPDAIGTALTVQRTDSDRFELAFSPAEKRPVRILQLTDTHFGNPDANSKRADERSFGEIRRLVQRHRPDLLVHTGDFINNDKGAGISFEAIDFFDDLNVPWTHVLGNHDIGAVSVPDFRGKMKHAAVGEFQSDGQPHYAFRLDLVGAAGGEPKFSLYGFNSGSVQPVKHVGREQIRWFEGQMRRDAEQGIQCPALAMIHIPVVEFEKLRSAQRYAGNFGESICFETDSGEAFAAFRRSCRLKGIFSGHDHRNDFQGIWDGIELVYGRVSGWTAYGELPRGGRLIEIDLDRQSYVHHLVVPAV
jgi:hypothetical protein